MPGTPDAEGADPQPYQALYRRFRPQRFSGILGQEHVTRALRHAVRDGKVAHAYLFSGPRGTGKTTTARVLAMALNCEHPEDGEPDGTCASCVAIRNGSSMDVQELDSASNRGIDEMRDLLSRVALGTPGRWKVYIVDEVHQMTPAAASAMLKTLEEPPGHVIFVLATTDPQKVLDTIRSRTQHFEFRLLPTEVLTSLLHDVIAQAGLDVPDDAVDVVIRRGHGSARDALSALDQVAASGTVVDDSAVAVDIVAAIENRDASQVLTAVAEAVTSGRDPRRLAEDVLRHLRNAFLATRAPGLVTVPEDALAGLTAQANRLGVPTLVRSMEVLGQALIDMREAVDPRITLEVALVRLAAPEADDSPAALLERIERLERAAAHGTAPIVASAPLMQPTPASPQPASSPPRPADAPKAALGALRKPRPAETPADTPAAEPTGVPHEPPSPPSKPAAPAAGGPLPTREELTMAWGDRILPSLRPGVKVYLSSGRFLAVEADAAVYAVPDKGLLGRATPSLPEVEAALQQHFGRPVPIRLVLDDGSPTVRGAAAPPPAADNPGDYDLTDLRDAPGAVLSPEQRLLEAFPGAEEVQ